MVNALSSMDAALRTAGRRLVDWHPASERLLLHVRDRYARAHVHLRTLANRVRYDAPPDPYRFVEVDPARVDHHDPLPGPKFRWAGAVTDGDWDRTSKRFADMDVYRAYEAHFERGVPWTETEFFDRVVAEIEAGEVNWGCTSREEFEARCERLDDLYETIRTEGYRTQDELLDADVHDPIKDQHRLKTERLKDEIAVNVGRDGEVLFSDGRNRLSIVKLLDLDAVPVRVLRRHREWQAVRDAYVRGDYVPDHLRDHPDLAALDRG